MFKAELFLWDDHAMALRQKEQHKQSHALIPAPNIAILKNSNEILKVT